MNWAAFYFWASIITVFIVVGGPRHPGRRQHIIAAIVLLGSWIASWVSRNITGDISPVTSYIIVDIALISVFGWLMFLKRAIWACFCVLLTTASIVYHGRYYFSQITERGYIEATNILFLAMLIVVSIAGTTGRYAWGEFVDRLFPRPWGYTFSGLVFPRDPDRIRPAVQ